MNWDDILAEQEHLEHHGVIGMKWGQRRYQNKDGSLTSAGRIHYGVSERRKSYDAKKKQQAIRSGDMKTVLKNRKNMTDKELEKAISRVKASKEISDEYETKKREAQETRKETIKKGISKAGELASAAAEKHAENKAKRAEKKAAKKAEKERKAAEKHERKLSDIINSGDIDVVLKNKVKLTDAEFEKAIARVKRTQELRDIVKAEKAEKDAVKLSKESMKSAERVAKENAKIQVEQIKASNKGFDLQKGVNLAGNIAKFYTSYKTIGSAIAAMTGAELPGIGSRDKTPKNDDDKSTPKTSSASTPATAPKTASTPTVPTTEPKTTSTPDIPKAKSEPEYKPVYETVREVKLSDMYDRAGIMPELSTSLIRDTDVARGRTSTSPYLGTMMSEITTPSADFLEPYKPKKRESSWL